MADDRLRDTVPAVVRGFLLRLRALQLRRSVSRMTLLAGVLAACDAHAHGGHPHFVDAESLVDLWLAFALVSTGLLYAHGVFRLARSARTHRRHIVGCAISFTVGWGVLAAALLSPLAGAAEQLFSAHMIQHELLMVAAAPLMVLGAPLAVWTWALPPRWRQRVAAPFHERHVRNIWCAISTPFAATLLHAVAIWMWHVPALFERAEASVAVHTLQHCAFLFSALLFWWTLLKPARDDARLGAAVVCLFLTMLHTGALGVLLTFSAELWYPVSTAGAGLWGLTPLEDQQLGGLVMWVPGGLPYVIAALLLAARLFVDRTRISYDEAEVALQGRPR
jgi:putative membrane protein